MGTGGPIARRLSWYWQVELANVVLVPAFFAFFAYRHGTWLGWPTVAALVPVCGLLAVGGLYWRGKLHALKRSPSTLDTALALADRWGRPLLILTGLAVVLAGAMWLVDLPGSVEADRIAVPIAALLAVAEYVN